MEEKIKWSLFEDFFQLSSPTSYAKMLINTKDWDENKKNVEEIENRISDLKDRVKRMGDKEKKDKNVNDTLEVIKSILITIRMLKIFFIVHQKLIKENQNQRLKRKYCRYGKIKK